jgi:hypothetical protein
MGARLMKLGMELQRKADRVRDYCSRWNNASQKVIIEPTFRPTLSIDAFGREPFRTQAPRGNGKLGVNRSVEMADKTEYTTRSDGFKHMRDRFSVDEPVGMDFEAGKPLRNGASPLEAPLNARQLAEILPLHPVTILKWARQGKIPCHRLSARKIVFLPSEITRWLSDYTDKAVRAA